MQADYVCIIIRVYYTYAIYGGHTQAVYTYMYIIILLYRVEG